MLRMGDVRCTIWWLWIHVPRGRMHCKSHFQALDHIKYAFLQVPFNMLQRQMEAKQFRFFFSSFLLTVKDRDHYWQRKRGAEAERKARKRASVPIRRPFDFTHTEGKKKKRQNPPLAHYWGRRCWWFSPLSYDADLQETNRRERVHNVWELQFIEEETENMICVYEMC